MASTTVPRERPILFSAPMVLALLAGAKTQTRRVVKPWHGNEVSKRPVPADLAYLKDFTCYRATCPYGEPRDRLWVRETIRLVPDQAPDDGTGRVLSVYGADGAMTVADAWPWKNGFLPPMHCPRGLSRILLEITEVGIERLQDISRGDAMDEGCPFPNMAQGDDPRKWYAELWDQINGAGAWTANPWVWVVSFKVIKP